MLYIRQTAVSIVELQLERLPASLPTEQEYYVLIESYPLRLLQITDIMEQDAIYDEVVSNLCAVGNAVTVITFNEPYE